MIFKKLKNSENFSFSSCCFSISKNQEGMGIVEIIIAMGLFVMLASVGAVTVLHSFSANRLGEEETTALLFAQEGVEGMRSIKNQGWGNITPGSYGLDKTSGTWVLSGSSNTLDQYTREIVITPVQRDVSGNIVDIGGVVDNNTLKISSEVNWNFTADRANTIELVTYITNWRKTIGSVEPDDLAFEVGSQTVSGVGWNTVNLDRTYESPVVLIQPVERNGGHESIIRIQNVTPTSFQFRIQEASCRDDTGHATETIGYIVMEEGTYEFPDGRKLEAIRYDSSTHVPTFDTVNFGNTYVAEPVVISQIQTYNEAQMTKTREQNITVSSAQIGMEEEAAGDGVHATETVGVIVFEPGVGTIRGVPYEFGKVGDSVTSNFYTLSWTQSFSSTPIFVGWFDSYNDPDTAEIRYRNLNNNSVQIQVEEDCSSDTHEYPESFSYIAFEEPFNYPAPGGTIADDITFDGTYNSSGGAYSKIINVVDNIYAVTYSDWSNDGWVKTLEIQPDGTVTNLGIDSLEFDTSNTVWSDIVKVEGDIYAVVYEGPGSDGWIKTFTIDSSGNISNSTIDSLEFDNRDGRFPEIVYVTGEYYAIAYQGRNSDGFVVTVSIDSSGNISNSTIDSLEFDNSDGREPDIIKITDSVIAVAYRGSGNDGFLKTIDINSSGQISNSVIDTLEFNTSYCEYPSLVHVQGDIYAIAYAGDIPAISMWWGGVITTVEISSNGQIGNSPIADISFDDDTGQYPHIINVAGDIFSVTYLGSDSDGWVKTFQIPSDGNMTGVIIDSLEYDTEYGFYPDSIHIDGDMFGIVYTAPPWVGQIKTIEIETGL